ncbi:MAG: hypothetical protein A2107_00825 [Verrucomicrobia bacterium GWF2_62_7]|nr:MAG: hypothetical protein A2107_00825 [Verrucomicrobia bacterium GWF2_62_7]
MNRAFCNTGNCSGGLRPPAVDDRGFRRSETAATGSRAFNNQTTTSGWLIGQSTHQFALGRIDRQDGNGAVEFGSALQSLVYGRDSLNLQSQVFLPPITNVQ